MSIDLNKLSPTPWLAECGELFRPDSEPYLSLLPHNSPHGHVYDAERRETDLAFVALARAAFEVMMRRSWGVEPDDEDGWVVCINDPTDPRSYWRRTGPDPFTALVDADAWYRQHVENQPAAP